MSIKSESVQPQPKKSPTNLAHLARLLREGSGLAAAADRESLLATQLAAAADSAEAGNVQELRDANARYADLVVTGNKEFKAITEKVADLQTKLDKAHDGWRRDVDELELTRLRVAELAAELERLRGVPAAREVFAVGSEVLVGRDVAAVVTSVTLSIDGVSYQVAWWAGRERREAALLDAEVAARPTSVRAAVGFRPGL